MKTLAAVSYFLAASALTPTVVLLIVPTTRRTVVRSAGVLDGAFQLLQTPSYTSAPALENRSFARAHAHDVDVQIAEQLGEAAAADTSSSNASEDVTEASEVNRLQSLTTQFPRSPALYSAIIRWGSRIFERDDSNNSSPAAARVGELLIRDASTGEQIDRGNQFFPCMAAAILFKLNRSRDALQQLTLCRNDGVWNDYVPAEVRGRLLIFQSLPGIHDSVMIWAVYDATYSPHYFAIRNAARSAENAAELLERTGNPDAGIRIRQIVMRAGSSMRRQSPTLESLLAGRSLESGAFFRLGGTSGASTPVGFVSDKSTAQMRAHRTRYLTDHGYAVESAWADTEHRNIRIIVDGCSKGMGGSEGVYATTYSTAMRAFVLAICLSNALWLLLLGIAAVATVGLIRRSRHSRRPFVLIHLFIFCLVCLAFLRAEAISSIALSVSAHDTWEKWHSLPAVPADTDYPVAAVVNTVMLIAIPVLLIVFFTLRVILFHQSLRVVAAQELPAACMAMASLLILVCASLILPATFQEQTALSDVRQAVNNETAFYLKAAGVRPPVESPAPPVQAASLWVDCL